jgi:ankyrin repeat protein
MAPPLNKGAASHPPPLCRHFCCLLLAAALFCAAIAFFTPPFEYKGVRYEAAGAAHARRARAPGRYELYAAARAGDLASVRDLLRRGARVDAASPMGVSALHIAASLGRTDVLRELLAAERGVFSSGADVHGNTPLLLAAAGGHADAVTLLLAAGADVKARTVYDLATPMMRASRVNNLDVTRLLLKSGSDPDMIDVRLS